MKFSVVRHSLIHTYIESSGDRVDFIRNLTMFEHVTDIRRQLDQLTTKLDASIIVKLKIGYIPSTKSLTFTIIGIPSSYILLVCTDYRKLISVKDLYELAKLRIQSRLGQPSSLAMQKECKQLVHICKSLGIKLTY